MTNTCDDHSLSRLELVVLARLSSAKPPGEKELAEAVREFALPAESPRHAREIAAEAVAALRGRGLVNDRRSALTDDGGRALRAAFDLGRTPTWSDVRDAHLPALALGLQPGSEEASTVVRTTATITTAVLRTEFGIEKASTVSAVCDALIVKLLGMPPGPVTLARIRTHVLARYAGVEAKGKLDQLAPRIAAATLGTHRADKRSLVRALGRRWAYKVISSQSAGSMQPIQQVPPIRQVQLAPPAPPIPSVKPDPPASSVPPVKLVPPASSVQPLSSPSPGSPPSPVQPIAADTLLAVVRETIPRIGADGRFGPDKVFVSAIWHTIEHDRRLLDLSLDRFKRWLVIANRDRLLDLARADLVGAMDAHLVAESEIEYLGSTFHFVLDHQAVMPGSERRSHAR